MIAKKISVCLLATILVICASEAQAKPKQKKLDLAHELFVRSEELYNEGRFQEAAALLKEAYTIRPEPVLLYNQGRCLEAAGDLTGAIAVYERYLEEAPNSPDEKQVRTRLKTLHKLEEDRKLAGTPSEKTQPAESAVAPAPPPPAPNEAAKVQSRKHAPVKSSPEESSSTPWIVAASGAAVLAGGVIFALLASSQHDDAQNDPVQQSAQDKQDTADTYATLSGIGFLVGGVVTAAGLGWGIWELNSSPSTSTSTNTTASLKLVPTGLLFSSQF